MHYANLIQRVNAARPGDQLIFDEVAEYLNPDWEHRGEPFDVPRVTERRELFLRSMDPHTCPKPLLRFIVNLLIPHQHKLPSFKKVAEVLHS